MCFVLDVSVFRGMKSRWDASIAEWTRRNFGKAMNKSVFSNIMGQTWASVSRETIRAGFEKTGIFDINSEFPVNKSKIDEYEMDSEKLALYKLKKSKIDENNADNLSNCVLNSSISKKAQYLGPESPT